MERRRYRIMQPLGEGGFGTVYRAEPLVPAGGLQHQVVLKVIQERRVSSDTVEQLREEAKVLKHLNHPAVVGVEDMVSLEKGWAVVSEYVTGVYLSDLIEQAPLPAHIALELIEDIAVALRAAYNAPDAYGQRLRLIHRDLRPANIRITPEGKIKVLDFGGARAEFALPDDGRDAVEKSRSYVPPERAEGREGPEGDVFSLGVILCECLLGEFLGMRDPGEEEHALWMEHLKSRLKRRLRRDNEDIPPELAATVVEVALAMLVRDPHERPDAQEVADACALLRKELGGEWIRIWAKKNISRMLAEQDTLLDDQNAGDIVSEVVKPVGPNIQKLDRPRRRSSDQGSSSKLGWIIAAVAVTGAVGLIVFSLMG